MSSHALSYHAPIIQRGSGQKQSVASAAYQLGMTMKDERDGNTYSYTKEAGRVVASGFVRPEGVPAHLTENAQRFWNVVEKKEDAYNLARWKDPAIAEAKNANAQIAMGGHFTLANEISLDEAKAVAEEVCQRQFASRGMVSMYAIHWDHGNHHIHFQATMRKWKGDQIAAKAFRKPEELAQFNLEMRAVVAEVQNRILQENGIDAHVEHRSHKELGRPFEPSVHVGPVAAAMIERGEVPRQVIENEDVAKRNRERIANDPQAMAGVVLSEITIKNAVVTEAEIGTDVFNRVGGEAELYEMVMPLVMADSRLERVGDDLDGKAVYTTTEYRKAEDALFAAGRKLDGWQVAGTPFGREHFLGKEYAWLNSDQKAAILHMTSGKGLVLVEGLPGTGKTTCMVAARKIWQQNGSRVMGAAVAWKAAKTLETESGIKSFSVASIVRRIQYREHLRKEVWEAGTAAKRRDCATLDKLDRESLGKGDVLVIDEAGMIDVRSMAVIMQDAAKRGYTVAGIGDRYQFQAIGAGRAFGGLVDEFGCVRLEKINRQGVDVEDILAHVEKLSRQEARARANAMSRADRIALIKAHGEAVLTEGGIVWRREAAANFAKWETRAALESYNERGFVSFDDTGDQAKARLVSRYFELLDDGVTQQAVFTFTNADCDDLNSRIREEFRQRGVVGEDIAVMGGVAFAAGDRVMFTDNEAKDKEARLVNRSGERILNNDIGKITESRLIDGRQFVTVALDDGRVVHVNTAEGAGLLRHAWAMTGYKSQGQTIGGLESGAVHHFASRFDKAAAANVAGTRAKDDTYFYASREEFADIKELADGMRRVQLKTLARDFDREPERDAVVREFKALGREIGELAEKIDAETPDEGDRNQHPDSPRLVELLQARKAVALQVANDRPSFQQICQRGRVSWEQIEIAAGHRERALTDRERQAKAAMLGYAATATEARDLWNSIKAEARGARAKLHPDYGRFDQLRRDRDAQAAEMVAEAKLHRKFTRDAEVSWKAITGQAEAHRVRVKEAARLDALTPEERAARVMVATYRDIRAEAAALRASAFPAEATAAALNRDRLAAGIVAVWERTEEWAAELNVDDSRLEQQARAHEARELVNLYTVALDAGHEAEADRLALEIISRHRADKGAREAEKVIAELEGRKPAYVALTVAAAMREAEAAPEDWRELRARAAKMELRLADQAKEAVMQVEELEPGQIAAAKALEAEEAEDARRADQPHGLAQAHTLTINPHQEDEAEVLEARGTEWTEAPELDQAAQLERGRQLVDEFRASRKQILANRGDHEARQQMRDAALALVDGGHVDELKGATRKAVELAAAIEEARRQVAMQPPARLVLSETELSRLSWSAPADLTTAQIDALLASGRLDSQQRQALEAERMYPHRIVMDEMAAEQEKAARTLDQISKRQLSGLVRHVPELMTSAEIDAARRDIRLRLDQVATVDAAREAAQPGRNEFAEAKQRVDHRLSEAEATREQERKAAEQQHQAAQERAKAEELRRERDRQQEEARRKAEQQRESDRQAAREREAKQALDEHHKTITAAPAAEPAQRGPLRSTAADDFMLASLWDAIGHQQAQRRDNSASDELLKLRAQQDSDPAARFLTRAEQALRANERKAPAIILRRLTAEARAEALKAAEAGKLGEVVEKRPFLKNAVTKMAEEERQRAIMERLNKLRLDDDRPEIKMQAMKDLHLDARSQGVPAEEMARMNRQAINMALEIHKAGRTEELSPAMAKEVNRAVEYDKRQQAQIDGPDPVAAYAALHERHALAQERGAGRSELRALEQAMHKRAIDMSAEERQALAERSPTLGESAKKSFIERDRQLSRGPRGPSF